MSLYKPSELLNFLQSLGISPKKSLSQNFLLDRNIIDKIVAVSHVQASDHILEIGPGPGSLTEALLEKGAKVVAVEKDKILAEALKRLKGSLTVFSADILKFSLQDALQKEFEGQKGKVIANLPYHITTPIITTLLPMNNLFTTITVLVQEEVARRFTASPGSKEYGSITLFLRFYSNPVYAFTVSHNCFFPKPSVESAVVTFTLKEPPAVSDREKFFTLIHTAFQQRRKMMRASLKALYPGVSAALEKLGLNPQARPEELALEDFISLYEYLNS